MHWATKYIGIPYSEMNCADLAYTIQVNEFSKNFSDIPKPEKKNIFHYSNLLKKHLFEYIEKEIEHPIEGCCVIMKARNRVSHVGVYTEYNSKKFVIHSMENFGSSVLHQIKDLNRFGLKIEGFFSWKL